MSVQDYDPQLALKTLKGEDRSTEQVDNRQLLVELGLADDSDDETASTENLLDKSKQVSRADEQQNKIPAYYPNNSSEGMVGGWGSFINSCPVQVCLK